MKLARFVFIASLTAAAGAAAADPAYVKSVEEWRAKAEQGLKRDNGWLTLAGRYVMKPGANTFGTAQDNDIVFPPGLGPDHMGTLFVEPSKVTLKLNPGVTMMKEGKPVTEREMGTDPENRDMVTAGRLSFWVLHREDKYVLRIADNESDVRKKFAGRVWYGVNDKYLVKAKFVPYDPPHKISLVDVIDQVSDEPSPGYVEFTLNGQKRKLDVIGDDDGLFFVFRDDTAGKTTYGSGRFLYVEKKPKPGETFLLDLNRAYNPPCAFSEFTTCPLPPKQNILKTKIEAGEKYPPKKLG